MRIILASASPRRKELLEMMGLDFEIIPAAGETVPEGLSPGETVAAAAMEKAKSVYEKVKDDSLIIAADTLVFCDGRALGKPKSEKEAFNMLKSLSGREHFVYTGVALIKGDKKVSSFEKTADNFCPMTDDEIRRYIATKEPMDKAGAYGVQGKGAVFIEGIDGDFFNVMGLPMHRLSKMLEEFEIQLI